jgi:hypothetical protein
VYRNCIFYSADFGTNDAVEVFPVGRQLAFDGWRGRLWAVCPTCARWNFAPIEERWEAVEQAEKLFRDARLRVQPDVLRLGCRRAASGATPRVPRGPGPSAVQTSLPPFRQSSPA